MRLKNRWLILTLIGILAATIIFEMHQSAGDPNQPLFTWGADGSGNGQFSSPEGIAINRSGHVYVVDTGNNRIQVFDQAGEFISTWGTAGSNEGQFQSPHGVALDNLSNVYVVDTGNNRIQVFNATGQFIRKWGSEGIGDAQFNMPWGIALDANGHVFVTDTNNDRVQAFNQTGNFWRSFGSDLHSIIQPRGIMNCSNQIIITHKAPNCYLAQINVGGTGGGGSYWGNEMDFNEPYGITIDRQGTIFIADTGNNRVVVYAALDPWGNPPPNPRTIWRGFLGPRGIAINTTGQIYVTDTGNNRVVVANTLVPFIPTESLFPWIISIILIIAITIVISIPYPSQPEETKGLSNPPFKENLTGEKATKI